jgi:ParB family chromosome partitioning protein
MRTLLESIEDKGVIVPLIVYRDDGKYRLLDGERRLRCAKRLNLKEVPANIIARPTPMQNILQMFHIHNVRKDWELIETALKLQVLLQQEPFIGKNEKQISELTSLSAHTVKRCKELLDLDPSYRQMILDTYKLRDEGEEIPESTSLTEDFFIESKRAINSIKRHQKEIYEEYGEGGLLKKFVEKRTLGTFSNVIQMGRMIPKISSAGKKGAPEKKVSRTLRKLIEDPEFSVESAYGKVAEPIYSSLDVERKCESLSEDLKELAQYKKDELAARKQQLVKVLNELKQTIVETVSQLK